VGEYDGTDFALENLRVTVLHLRVPHVTVLLVRVAHAHAELAELMTGRLDAAH
jgi:hypothetical protein